MFSLNILGILIEQRITVQGGELKLICGVFILICVVLFPAETFQGLWKSEASPLVVSALFILTGMGENEKRGSCFNMFKQFP